MSVQLLFLINACTIQTICRLSRRFYPRAAIFLTNHGCEGISESKICQRRLYNGLELQTFCMSPNLSKGQNDCLGLRFTHRMALFRRHSADLPLSAYSIGLKYE